MIIVKEKEITITKINEDDYISLTDIAKVKNDGDTNMVIASWIRRVDTIEFLKLWELINNENFKPTDFDGFKSKPGQNAFTISPKKWIELTNAIEILNWFISWINLTLSKIMEQEFQEQC